MNRPPRNKHAGAQRFLHPIGRLAPVVLGPVQNQTPTAGQLSTDKALDFILAGNATFTVKNTKSGNRFTYLVTQPSPTTPHFVKVLTGPNNTADFQYLGTIFDGKTYRHGRKSRIGSDAQSNKTFEWLFAKLVQIRETGDTSLIPSIVEIWHEGTCGCCGRTLTVPESIASGFGPVCAAARVKKAATPTPMAQVALAQPILAAGGSVLADFIQQAAAAEESHAREVTATQQALFQPTPTPEPPAARNHNVIRNAKTIQAKSRDMVVTHVFGSVYEVASTSGETYQVRYRNGTAICGCEWGQFRPTSDPRCGCSHAVAVLNYVALNTTEPRTVSVWVTEEDALRQHRPVVEIGDGVLLTGRLLEREAEFDAQFQAQEIAQDQAAEEAKMAAGF